MLLCRDHFIIFFKCSALWQQQLSCLRCKQSLCLVVYSFHQSNGTLTSGLAKFKSHKILWRALRGLWLLASCPVIFRLTSVLSNRNKTRHLQLQMKGSLVISVLLTHIDLDVHNSLEQPKNAFIKILIKFDLIYWFDWIILIKMCSTIEWQQNNSSSHYH